MIWVGWRQQRTETLIALGVLAVLALLLLPTGLQMAHAYDRDGVGACLGAHPGLACDGILQSFQNRFESFSGLLGWLTLLPGLIGVLLAAPFVLQFESGAYRLDWTQGITRRRWIATKLALAVAATVAASLVFIALVTWWRAPLVHVTGRLETAVFDSEGVVAVGYALFALGLALAIGVIWRRAVAGLVVGFLTYFVARLFVDTWLRQRLTPPLEATFAARAEQPRSLADAWVITESPSDRFGHLIHPSFDACSGAAHIKSCLAGAGYSHAVYEPASRFWSMQLVELGLFSGVALVLIAFAAWWTARRV